MEERGNSNKFEKAVIGVFERRVVPVDERANKDDSGLSDFIYGNEDQHKTFFEQAVDGEDEWEYPHMILYGHAEIVLSQYALQDIEVYISRFPYGKTSIPRVRHLRHNMEVFLHEFYVLYCRIISYLNRIRRAHKCEPRRPKVEAAVDELKEWLSDALDEIVKVRGVHVHQLRYDNSDLLRLDVLHRATSVSEDFEDMYRDLYQRIRREKKQLIRAHNEQLAEILDDFFARLLPIVFDESLNLIVPEEC